MSPEQAERDKCKRDVCMYCAGHVPTHEREVVGPNEARNYVHMPTGAHTKGGQLERLSRLCIASSIFLRERFENSRVPVGKL